MRSSTARPQRRHVATLHALAVSTMVLCAGLASPTFAQSTADRLGGMRPLDLVPPVSRNFDADSAELAAARAQVKRGVVAPQLQMAAILQRQGNADWAHAAGLERSEVDGSSRVSVELRLGAGKRDAALARLQALGFENRFPRGTRLLQGWLPVAAIEQAGAIDGVAALQPARKVKHFAGSKLTEGVASGRVERWHDAGIDGTGLTIAVIDGFRNAAVAGLQASGDWPADAALTKVGPASGGLFGMTAPSDHGMAALEIAYDVAPGAEFIAYHTYLVSDWVAAIYDAVDTRGANIISASLGAPLDGVGDGTALPDSVAEAAEYARANNVIVVNAAGNERLLHYGGVYDSDGVAFTNALGTYDGSHRFNPGNPGALGETKACAAYPGAGLDNSLPLLSECFCVPDGYSLTMQLYWNDWQDVDNDFDVLLYRLGGTSFSPTWTLIEAGSSSYPQTGDASGGETPAEYASDVSAGTAMNTSPGCPSDHRVYAYQIAHVAGTADTGRNLQAFTYWDMPVSLQVHERSLGFPADSAGVVTVAALDVSTSVQEDYSSEGPILAPGGGLPTGSEALKPDVASFANVSTAGWPAAYGLFNGTSAATPHVAGMAALLWQRMGGPGVAAAEDVRAALMDLAGTGSNDLGDAGAETQHGAGRVRFQVENELAFLQQPSDTSAGAAIDPPVEMAVLDDEGEPVLNGLIDSIELALGIDPSAGTATLGDNSADVLDGTATFSTLNVDTVGTGYTLAASATTLNSESIASAADSDAFDVAEANNPPIYVTAIPEQTNDEGDSVELDLNPYFSDPDGDALTISILPGDMPSGLTLGSDGRITGTIDYAAADHSPYTTDVTVNDVHGGRVDVSFTWNVVANLPPTRDSDIDDQTHDEGETVDLDLSEHFSDPEGDALTFSLGAGTLPSGLALSGDGRITGTIDYTASAGSLYGVSITVSDGRGGGTFASFTWEVLDANQPPTLAVAIPDQMNAEGDAVDLDLSVHFADPEGDALSYAFTSGTLPAGLTLSGSRVVGTIDYTAATGIPYPLTVTADDGNGGTRSEAFDWNVLDTNRAPTLGTTSIDQTNAEGDSVSLDLNTHIVDPDGDTLTYSLVAGPLPSGLSLASDGRITGTLEYTAADGSPYGLTVRAEDSDGGRVDAGFNWIVTNTNQAPTLMSDIPNQINTALDAVDFDIAAYFSDADGDALIFSLDGALPSGLSLTGDGRITGTIDSDAANGSPYEIAASAADGDGGSAFDTFLWYVTTEANRAPVLLSEIPGQTNLEGDSVELDLNDYIADPDADPLTFSVDGLPPGLTQVGDRIEGSIDAGATDGSPYTVTVTADDDRGGSVSDTFLWTVKSADSLFSDGFESGD